MPSRNDTPDLDFDLLSELRDIMGTDFVMLVRSWQRDADTRLAAIQKALKDRNATELRQVAHSLKGSSANLGARHVVVICQQLESLAGDDDLVTAKERIESLHHEINIAAAALDRLVGT